MCRSIHRLFNYEPEATEDEIREASLQFVRKISGFRQPSSANREAFDRGIEEVTDAVKRMLAALETSAPPRSRETDLHRARQRHAQRFHG